MIEPFRSTPVIPEIFNRESKCFYTVDPGLKIALQGDEVESMSLLFFLAFKPWTL